ncbi:hypothetical protein HYALB_00001959 [Hymenoscyphus albidus]|uniref:Uncharacterized protein n=1 Tax=Hymenoscyphus albidus TaxID=595503 RepID=A0A9N9PQZ4_9HELO|nr:hypothetical protein HYALB_00001959 [Hymenoscyphus albidus]
MQARRKIFQNLKIQGAQLFNGALSKAPNTRIARKSWFGSKPHVEFVSYQAARELYSKTSRIFLLYSLLNGKMGKLGGSFLSLEHLRTLLKLSKKLKFIASAIEALSMVMPRTIGYGGTSGWADGTVQHQKQPARRLIYIFKWLDELAQQRFRPEVTIKRPGRTAANAMEACG